MDVGANAIDSAKLLRTGRRRRMMHGRRRSSALCAGLEQIVLAAWRGVDDVAARGQTAGKTDAVAGPFRGFGERIVGADHLRAGVQESVAASGVIGAGGDGAVVGAGADDVALANELIDEFGRTAILFDEGSVGAAGVGVGEQHTALQKRMTG